MQRLMDRLNSDMTERFLDHQRRTQAALHHWELERRRQEEAMAERWRREAREHEARMFGMFTRMVSECNATMAAVVRLAVEHDTSPGGDQGESDVRERVAEENGVKVGDMVDGDEEYEEEGEDVNDDSDGA